MTRRRGTCARCNQHKPLHARGLCHPCHTAARDLGRLGDYPTRFEHHAERNERVLAALNSGMDVAAAAAHLGLTYDTVRSIARSKGLVGGGGGVPLSWFTPVAPAPTRVPCVGKTMDFDGFKPHQLAPSRNAAVRSALDLCATCPLATRQWCLDTVDPRGIGKEWQGVAGGIVWSNGRLVYDADASAVAS